MDIYPLIANRLGRDASVVDAALRVLDRWDAQGFGPPHRRKEWRDILLSAKASSQGRQALVGLLLDTREEARRLKDFAPFAGILSREDRRKAFARCKYDH